MPIKSVAYGVPRSQLTSNSLKLCLKSNLVPAVTTHCQVVAIRSAFCLASHQEATQQLAARRRQLELKALEHSEVSNIIQFHL